MPLDDPTANPYLAHFLASPSTVATFVVLCLIAIIASLSVRRRRLLVLATGIAAAAVGGLTLAPSRGWTTFTVLAEPTAAVRTALRPSSDDLWAWSVADGPANVALFVPFALCLGLLLRRPLEAFMISVALSVTIEAYQAATGTRIGTFADIVANSLGALIGAAIAAAAMIILDALGGRPRPGPDHRSDRRPPVQTRAARHPSPLG